MPEVDFTIRWADGHLQRGTSPSTAIERFLVEGASYPRAEMERRITEGLRAASERVRERYGAYCTAAAQLTEELTAGAAEHGGDTGAPARVELVRRHRPPPREVGELPAEIPVVVIGGGQAGLTVSRHLTERGIMHVVLERDRIASTWRYQRWDTFCLVTPNFQCRLPSFPYSGDDPDGFMVRDEIIAYVESFADSFGPPVHEGVEVTQVAGDDDGFVVETDHGSLHARQVVVCVGGYHAPRLPALAAGLPATVTQLHSSQYRNPSSLPDGAVLVVGSGQSGAQIAEDLQLAGRDTHLAVGSAPRVARRYRGRDCVAWLEDIGHYDLPVTDHKEGVAEARREPNHYVTGRGGGRDIDLRAHATHGMTLHGRLHAARDGVLSFNSDLAANLDAADATAERIKDVIDEWITDHSIDAPLEDRYQPVWTPGDGGSTPLDLGAADIHTIIWATGFISDWSWVAAPGFVQDDYPRYERGVSEIEGLYVLGLPWLWTWGSGRFAGIDRDATYVVDRLAAVADSQQHASARTAV